MLNKLIQRLRAFIFLKIVSFTIVFLLLNDCINILLNDLNLNKIAVSNAESSLGRLQDKLICLKDIKDYDKSQITLAKQKFIQLTAQNSLNNDDLTESALRQRFSNIITPEITLHVAAHKCIGLPSKNQWFNISHHYIGMNFKDYNLNSFLLNFQKLYDAVPEYKSVNSIKLSQNLVLTSENMQKNNAQPTLLSGDIEFKVSNIAAIPKVELIESNCIKDNRH